jgi:hypothetical protein
MKNTAYKESTATEVLNLYVKMTDRSGESFYRESD